MMIRAIVTPEQRERARALIARVDAKLASGELVLDSPPSEPAKRSMARHRRLAEEQLDRNGKRRAAGETGRTIAAEERTSVATVTRPTLYPNIKRKSRP